MCMIARSVFGEGSLVQGEICQAGNTISYLRSRCGAREVNSSRTRLPLIVSKSAAGVNLKPSRWNTSISWSSNAASTACGCLVGVSVRSAARCSHSGFALDSKPRALTTSIGVLAVSRRITKLEDVSPKTGDNRTASVAPCSRTRAAQLCLSELAC